MASINHDAVRGALQDRLVPRFPILQKCPSFFDELTPLVITLMQHAAQHTRPGPSDIDGDFVHNSLFDVAHAKRPGLLDDPELFEFIVDFTVVMCRYAVEQQLLIDNARLDAHRDAAARWQARLEWRRFIRMLNEPSGESPPS